MAKSASESPKGAGQYFTPRELIKAIVEVMQPSPDDNVFDPACGTGGFLLQAHDYVIREHGRELNPDQKRHLRESFVKGVDIVPATARLCIMNLYLHGIRGDPCPIQSGLDSLANDPGDRFSLILTNPPFGKKSSISIVNKAGEFKKQNSPVAAVCIIILIIGGVFAAISTNSSNGWFRGGTGWYRGGTLHQGTVRDWNNASKRNKIATAADFALSSQYVSAKVKNSGKMDTLKPYAQELATCIEEASARQGYKTMRISEIGASCIILLNW